MKTTAIVLSAGKGSRMKTAAKKQYLELGGKPVIWYSLAAFEASPLVDEIILVCGEGEEDWCRKEIAERFGLKKIAAIVPGGKERYHSVYEGLKAAEDCEMILIHDGARPMIHEDMIQRLVQETRLHSACVAAMPVKDTIKMSDTEGYVESTLPREKLWTIQTPQVFDYDLIRGAYEEIWKNPDRQKGITDDAMIVESMTGTRVKLVEGSYENLKITTPEDMVLAEALLHFRASKQDKK